jgi:uncharacterized protein
MKKLLLTGILAFFSTSIVFALDVMNFPIIRDYIQDYSNVLSPEQIQSIRTRASNYEKSTTEQAYVVLFPNRDGSELFDIGLKIFRDSGIGQAGKDNGILLLIATEEKKIRIVTGY